MDVIVSYTAPSHVPRVALPLSKSIEARRCLLAAIRGHRQPIEVSPGDCADIAAIKCAVQAYAARAPRIDVGESGTALRFLTALTSATPAYCVELGGAGSISRRPVGPLVDALRAMGADISYAAAAGFPPLVINGRQLDATKADVATLAAAGSSQYLSALLLVAPLMHGTLPDPGPYIATMVSAPYLRLTQRMVSGEDSAEADWSGAAFFYLVSLLTGLSLRLTPPLPPFPSGKQGDAACAPLFAHLGVETRYQEHCTMIMAAPADAGLPRCLDMSATPDLVPAVAVAMAAIGAECRLTGIGHLRGKESDRLQSVTDALRRTGFSATADDNGIAIDGRRRKPVVMPRVDCCGDHRIAMAFAPCAALCHGGIVLRGAECVAKSFPEYFRQLEECGFSTKEML